MSSSHLYSVIENKIPVGNFTLFVKFYKPSKLTSDTFLILLHWMDSRGSRGNRIYHEISDHFASKGIPVFLFDQSGSGGSSGPFYYPKKQANQVIDVYNYALTQLNSIDKERNWELIPIAHSIAGVTIMHALNSGLQFKMLVWLGGPPSHGNSVRNSLKKENVGLFKFKVAGVLDKVSGVFGKPIYHKMFGFKLRLKDMQEILKCHGAEMMIKRDDIKILGIFGTNDQYMTLNDLYEALPLDLYSHFRREIIEGATHSFEDHLPEVIHFLDEFIL